MRFLIRRPLLGMILVVALGLAGLGAGSYWVLQETSQDLFRESETQALTGRLRLRVFHLKDWMTSQSRRIRDLEDFIPQSSPQEFFLRLTRLRGRSSQFQELHLISHDGVLLFSTDKSANELRFPAKNWIFDSFKTTGRFTVVPEEASGRPVVWLAVPLRDEKYNLRYYVLAELNLGTALPVFNRNLLPGELAYAVAPGREWLIPPENVRILPVFQERDYIDEALSGRSGRGAYENFLGQKVLGTYHWDSELNVAFFLEEPDTSRGLPWELFLLPAFGLVVLLVLWSWGLRKVYFPLQNLTRLLENPVESRQVLALASPPWSTLFLRLARLLEKKEETIRVLENALGNSRYYMNKSPDLVLEIDQEGTILFASEGGKVSLGLNMELEGQNIEHFLTTGSHPGTHINLLLRAPTGHRFYRWVKLGTERKIYLESVVVHDGPRHLLICRDITQEHSSSEMVRQKQKMASLGQFSEGVVQDFTNLLAGLSGRLTLAELDLENHGAVEHLQEAQTLITKARTLTQDLMTIAAGGIYQLDSVDTGEILSPVLQSYESLGLTIFKNLIPDPLPVRADKDKLKVVFQEILENVKVFVGLSKPLVVVSEYVSLPKEGGEDGRIKYLRFGFLDKGPGIPPEFMEKVFEPYFSTKPGAKGLGLSVVYSLVTRFGGFVEVDSQVGEGTLVKVYLPTTES